MNLGKLLNVEILLIDKMLKLNLSLPYLDPIDPFFQQVGIEILNEVCYFTFNKKSLSSP